MASGGSVRVWFGANAFGVEHAFLEVLAHSWQAKHTGGLTFCSFYGRAINERLNGDRFGVFFW